MKLIVQIPVLNEADTIADVDFLGSVLRIKVTANDTTIAFATFNDPSSPPPRPCDKVTLSFGKFSLLILQN